MALTFYLVTNAKKSVSPELLECRDLELAVPGTYRAGKFQYMVSRQCIGVIPVSVPSNKYTHVYNQIYQW
jgi:hypothetical protein